MIKNYILMGHGDLVSFSPFCLKTDLYLRMRGLPYENVYGSPRSAPKGKLPSIVDGDVTLADSQLIIEYLEEKYPEPLDGGLDGDTRARHHFMRRALEEGLYFCSVYARWLDPVLWPEFRALIAPQLPKLAPLIMPLVRRQLRRDLWGQGTARHSSAEIYKLARADIDAMAASLGDAPYFGGEVPRTIDATAFGFVGNALMVELSSPIADGVRAHENLVAYGARVRERFYANG